MQALGMYRMRASLFARRGHEAGKRQERRKQGGEDESACGEGKDVLAHRTVLATRVLKMPET